MLILRTTIFICPLSSILLFFMSDYHCHLVQFVEYAKDEMNGLKHLNAWQHLLSLVTTSHIKRFPLATTFFLPESDQMRAENKPWTSQTSIFRRAEGGGNKKKKEKQKEKHNRWETNEKGQVSRFWSELKGMQMSSHRAPFPGDRYVRALKALAG